MRFVSLILAIFVAAALSFWILQRERAQEFFAGMMAPPAAEGALTQEETPQETAEEDIATDDTALIKVVARKSIAREIDSAVVLRGQTEAVRQVDVRAET